MFTSVTPKMKAALSSETPEHTKHISQRKTQNKIISWKTTSVKRNVTQRNPEVSVLIFPMKQMNPVRSFKLISFILSFNIIVPSICVSSKGSLWAFQPKIWANFSCFFLTHCNSTEMYTVCILSVYCLYTVCILSSYSKHNQMHQFLKFIYFLHNTLHVSDGLSVRNSVNSK
jgi:hypothetical protein